ncbi:MAG: patatin, partial [Thermodesulfobacteriota bacterium]
ALARYSLSDKEYYAHLEQRGRFAREDRDEEALAFIRIENRSRVADDVIRDRITQQSGEPLDIDRLETDISHIYGLDLFSSVRYEIVEENGAEGLVVSAAGKDWRPAYLQAGLAFSSNLSDESGFQVGALYTRTQLNSLNGELRLGVQLADEPAILTEIYQPLDPAGRYFLNARASYGGTNVNVFDEDYHRQAREFVTAWDIDLAGGREFGTWGEIFLGYRLGGGEIERSIGEQVPDRRFDVGEAVLGLRGDTLDNLYFPTSGWLGWAEWHGSREGIGADQDFDQFRLGYNQAFSRGKNSLIVSALANTTLDDEAPVQNLYRLGGFLRLSGLQEQQLSGQHSGLARLVYLHRVQDAQFFQSYLGMSLEAGNVWQREEDIGLDNSLAGGSVFLGLDTPIGPFFLGYGLAEGGESSFYLYLGPLFSFGN